MLPTPLRGLPFSSFSANETNRPLRSSSCSSCSIGRVVAVPVAFGRRDDIEAPFQRSRRVLMLSTFLPVVFVADSSSMASAERGKQLFTDKECVGCHQYGGNVVESDKTLRLNDLKRQGISSTNEVSTVIELGRGKMPGYGEKCEPKGKCTFASRLTTEEIGDLAEFVWKTANDSDEAWKDMK